MQSDRVHEILTQAVIFRENLSPVWSHSIPVEGVRNILGVKIAEDGITLSDQNNITLSARCEIWCEGASGSQVFTVHINHSVPLSVPETESGQETMVRALLTEAIRSTGADVTDDTITISLTAGLNLEVIAPICLTVPTIDPKAETEVQEESRQTAPEPETESDTEAERLAFVARSDAPAEVITPEPEVPQRSVTLTTKAANSSRVVITYLN